MNDATKLEQLQSTEKVVLKLIDCAIKDAMKGVAHETECEAIVDMDQQEIHCLEKWAKKMYHHFPKETASVVIDFADEVYCESFHIVRHLVEKTIYTAVVASMNVGRATDNNNAVISRSKLKNTFSTTLNKSIHTQTAKVSKILYNHDEIRCIAEMRLSAALFRARDLTEIYLDRRRKHFVKETLSKVRNMAELTEDLDQHSSNAMNYFYRQVLSSLEAEQNNAKLDVDTKYPLEYIKLLQDRSFRRTMNEWLKYEVVPHLVFDDKPQTPSRRENGLTQIAL